MEKIFEAALHNQTEVIKDYLKFGNVNLADSNKVSLLHYAAMGNSLEVANLLLDNYANLNVKNSKGEIPWNLYLKKLMGTVESNKKKTITRRNRRTYSDPFIIKISANKATCFSYSINFII